MPPRKSNVSTRSRERGSTSHRESNWRPKRPVKRVVFGGSVPTLRREGAAFPSMYVSPPSM